MNNAVREAFLTFAKTCESWRGRPLRVDGALSTNGQNFNRHFTTRMELTFTLTHNCVRLSGGQLVLLGHAHCYELATDKGVSLIWHESTLVELLERYSDNIFRRTRLRALPRPAC